MKFLVENAFKTPTWALNPEVLRRIEPVGVLDRIEASQTRVLNSLLSSARVLRLVEQEALDGSALTRRSISSPTSAVASGARSTAPRRPGGRVPPQSAACLRGHAQQPHQRPPGPVRRRPGVLPWRAEDARHRPVYGAGTSLDRATSLHIQDVRIQIARALDPAVSRPPAAARADHGPGRRRAVRRDLSSDLCWPDYVVKPRVKKVAVRGPLFAGRRFSFSSDIEGYI